MEYGSPDSKQLGINPGFPSLKSPAFANPNQVSVQDLNTYQSQFRSPI